MWMESCRGQCLASANDGMWCDDTKKYGREQRRSVESECGDSGAGAVEDVESSEKNWNAKYRRSRSEEGKAEMLLRCLESRIGTKLPSFKELELPVNARTVGRRF